MGGNTRGATAHCPWRGWDEPEKTEAYRESVEELAERAALDAYEKYWNEAPVSWREFDGNEEEFQEILKGIADRDDFSKYE